MTKHTYQLISLDMDGTLLNSCKEISPKTVSALRHAMDKGKEVVLCTGRCPKELEKYFHQLPGLRYCVCNSGAFIYDLPERKMRFVHPIEPKVLERLYAILRTRDLLPQIFMDGRPHFDREKMERLEDYQIDFYRPLFLSTGVFCDDPYRDTIREGHPVTKLCLYHRSPEQREETRQMLAGLPLVLADAEISSLEVTPAGADKGAGLITLCQYLDIPLEDAIAVGDSFNDLPVLNVAGLPVAMGNARDAVKDICAAVVADCDHDGVAEAVVRFLIPD